MIIDFEGVKLEVDNELPTNGGLYIAERNIGMQLLTALKVDKVNRWIIPKENAYVCDLGECRRVIKIIE